MANKSYQTIKRNSEFTYIKLNGSRYPASSWLLFNYAKNSQGIFRIGVTASRKVGPAVLRNKLKRWCRNYCRALVSSGQRFEIDINFIFKPSKVGFYKELTYSEFEKAMDRGFLFVGKNK